MKTTLQHLKSNRLTLRRFDESDLNSIYLGLSNPSVIKYYGVNCESEEAAKLQLRWFEDLERNDEGIWWAICSSERGEFLGAAGLSNVSKEHKRAEIGFWLLPANWKEGIISEAIPMVLSYAFRQLGIHRVEALVETMNANSKKVLARSGFAHEGTMRDCEIKNGNFISLDIYAKVRNSTR